MFRFNKYSKKSYIIKLLKDDIHVILEDNEIYESIAKNILKNGNIKNYRKYICDIYFDKFLLNLEKEDDFKEGDFEIKIFKKICFHPPCMNEVIDNNYCSIHNKDMI